MANQNTTALLGYSRFTGEPVALVPSQSQPNVYHLTTATACDCIGFIYRRFCNHLPPRTVRIPVFG